MTDLMHIPNHDGIQFIMFCFHSHVPVSNLIQCKLVSVVVSILTLIFVLLLSTSTQSIVNVNYFRADKNRPLCDCDGTKLFCCLFIKHIPKIWWNAFWFSHSKWPLGICYEIISMIFVWAQNKFIYFHFFINTPPCRSVQSTKFNKTIFQVHWNAHATYRWWHVVENAMKMSWCEHFKIDQTANCMH